MKKSKKITALMAALSVFGLTGCDLGSISDSIKNFDVWNLVDPLHWFHDKEDKDQDQDKDDDKDVAVTSVVVTPSTLSLKEGESRLLSVEVLPSNATDKTVTWTSSNPEVATVSNGNVVAVKEGTATIKATAGGKEGQCVVTVTKNGDTPPAPVEIDHIEIVGSLTKTSYKVGEAFSSEGLSVKAVKTDGTESVVSGSYEFTPAIASKGMTKVSVIARYSDNFVSQAKEFNITVIEEEQGTNYGTEQEPLTVSQALALITEECTEDKAMTAQAITVQGQITEVKNKYVYDNVPCFEFNISDGTSTVYVYRCHCTDQQAAGVVVGATVKLVGYAKNFKGTLEFVDNGASQCHILSIEGDTPDKELVSISIEGSLTKTEYVVGQTYSAAGLSVKGHYDDGTEGVVPASITLNKTTAALGDTEIIASAEYNGKTAEPKTFTISVVEGQVKNYGTEQAPLTVSQALALITEECTEDRAMTAQAITVQGQITEVKNKYVYDNVPCFEFNISDGTSTVYVYRCHCTDQQATGVVVGATVKLVGYAKNFKGTLEFVDNGASQCHILSIEGDIPDKELVSISIEGSLAKTEYVEGQAYSSAGLSVKGHYDDGSEGIVAATIILNKTTAVYGDTEIIASATFKEITAEPKTFTVTVTEKSPVAEGDFYKVKSQDEITEGQYLLVYEASETEAKVFNGIDVATKDGASAVDAAIEIDHIAANDSFVKVALETMDGGFALKVVGGTNDGKYMCGASGTNTTKFETTKQLNTITHSETGDSIVSNTSTIMYNKASDQARFRYYKEGTTTQQPVHLYKMKDGGTPTPVKELSSISIEGALTKTEYTVGETYSAEGLSVKGHYDDGTEGVVPASITLNKTTAALGDTEIIASAEYNGKTAEPKTFTVSVAEGQVKNYGTEQAPLTVSQALALITEECTEDRAMTAQAITVQGQITEVKNKYVYDNVPCFEFNISDGTSTVYVYRCHCTDQQATGVVVGATVKLVGYAKNFKGTLEFVDNGTSQCHILAVENNVPDKELSSISIEGALTKTTYTEGEAYSVDGLSVVGHYSDGSSADVSATITLDKTTAAVGDTQIVASAEFDGKTATKDLAVTVNAKKIVTGITFSEEHRTFDQYAEFVKETVTATFTVGDPEIVEATFSTPDMTTAGEKTITVSYTDAYGTTVNNSYTITVVGAPEPELTGITIEGELAKTAYTVGETYSAEGLSVVAHYDNGANNTVEVTINLDKTTAALGDTSITASATYEGKNVSKDFAVTTSEEQAQKGTLENPYTVAEVIEAYKNLPVYDDSSAEGKDACFSNERVYVQGLVVGDAPSTPQYTLDGGLIVYKPAAPTEFIRPCKGDVAIFEGYVEHYKTAFELASNTNHPGNPTCASVVSRGTSTISLDSATSANAVVTFEGSGTNASQYSFTVTANEGYQVSCVKFDGQTVEGIEGVYTATLLGNSKIYVETVEEGQKAPITVSNTISNLVTENGWAVSSGNNMNGCYTSFTLDSNVTVSTSGEPNCGSVWGTSPNNDWRLYRGNKGDLTISVGEGYKIVSVKVSFTVGNSGTLLNGDTQVSSNDVVMVDNTTITFTVGGGASGKTNGQIRVTAIEVVYIAL